MSDIHSTLVAERELNLPVIRHKYQVSFDYVFNPPMLPSFLQKPVMDAEFLERIGEEPERTVVVGDRYMTDILFGNMNGMLTVKVEPLDSSKENIAVRQVC